MQIDEKVTPDLVMERRHEERFETSAQQNVGFGSTLRNTPKIENKGIAAPRNSVVPMTAKAKEKEGYSAKDAGGVDVDEVFKALEARALETDEKLRQSGVQPVENELEVVEKQTEEEAMTSCESPQHLCSCARAPVSQPASRPDHGRRCTAPPNSFGATCPCPLVMCARGVYVNVCRNAITPDGKL